MTEQEKEWLCGAINAIQLLAKREGVTLQLTYSSGLDVRGISAVDDQLYVLEGPLPDVAQMGTIIYTIDGKSSLSIPFYELTLTWVDNQFIYHIDWMYSRKERLGTPARPSPRSRESHNYNMHDTNAVTIAETIVVCHLGMLFKRAGTTASCDACPLQLTCLGGANS